MSTETIAGAIERVIEAHAPTVERWRANEPGAWGFLAGKGIIAVRQAAGRPLGNAERRLVWQMLWDRLRGIRQERG